jgi:hypothetical protein
MKPLPSPTADLFAAGQRRREHVLSLPAEARRLLLIAVPFCIICSAAFSFRYFANPSSPPPSVLLVAVLIDFAAPSLRRSQSEADFVLLCAGSNAEESRPIERLGSSVDFGGQSVLIPTHKRGGSDNAAHSTSDRTILSVRCPRCR